MQDTLAALQAQVAELSLRTAPREELELDEGVLEYFPAHIQVKPMDKDERKREITKYPKCAGLPKALHDNNGLAAKAVGEGPAKKWVITHMPSLQREALDIVRMASGALQYSASVGFSTPEDLQTYLQQALQDICKVACDNAQRMARTQLETIFDAAGTKGASTLLKTGPDFDDNDLDPEDASIIRQGHVDAMCNIRKFCNNIAAARKKPGNGNNSSNNGRRNGWTRRSYRGGRGGGYRGRGGRGGGGWKGAYGGYDGGRSGYGGKKGSGDGSPNANSGS